MTFIKFRFHGQSPLINYLADKYIFEDREDILLELIAKDKKNENLMQIVIYGEDHVFGGKKSCGKDYSRTSTKDNIYEWNKKNPDKKFSLIEIFPEGSIN